MKSWAPEIRHHIETWATRLGPLRWWPRYVYHFTDVHNAASIIRSGHLYSRAEAERRGLMKAVLGIVTMHLDDALAFAGPLTFEEIPF